MLIFSCPVFSQNSAFLNDVKKEADKLFEDEEFTKAYKLYAQLVSNYPKDAEYNYRLGVCMIYSEPDKKRCIPYLKVAANDAAQKDALFYLAKAYHINYLFDEAIKNYTAYKAVASPARLKKMQVDKEIKACNNGKHLLSNMTDLVVKNKKQLNEADYFRSYDLKTMGGKLLVKPEEFKTPVDKKKKEHSVVFLPKGSNVVYFSSYGDNADNGKDIYTTAKLPNGTFGKAEKVKGINTEFDEDYPFLHPDGKTLYFASKGYNSMGGYDVFKTTYNEETNTWTAPVNLEFPINSPDDDFLFVTDSLEKTAYFSTGRQSPPGKIDVLKINTERRPIDVLVIKGGLVRENPNQSLLGKITVKKARTQEAVGSFAATENGYYTMELPNGTDLLFTVETPGQRTQSDTVSLPMATSSKIYRQSITYDNGDLKITNFFDEASNDDSYMEYLKVIEQKAKLDVNEGDNKLAIPETPLATKTSNPTVTDNTVAETSTEPAGTQPKRIINNNGPELVVTEEPGSATTSATPKQTIDNKQLASIAKQDAEESKQEAIQLERDSRDATEVGLKQKTEADKRLAEANDAIKAAEALTNETEKKPALEKAIAAKASAETDQATADKIIAFAKTLNNDAQTKRKEAELNNEYAKELEKTASNKNNNAQSLSRLEQLQKQIAETSGQKTASSETMDALKADIEEKEKQLASAEKINSDIKYNLEEVKTAITTKETELAQARKKAAKQEITTQITELKAEQADKEKQVADKDAEIKKINEELVSLKNEQDLATKIKTEDIAATTPATVAPTTNNIEIKENVSTPVATKKPEKITGFYLQEKYKEKVSIADPKNIQNIEESTLQLRSFNKEIDQALTKNKADLAKAKTAAAKQQITAEIKQLETTKKQNQQFIASNNKLVADLNKPAQPVAQTSNGLSPVVAATPAEAVKSLDQLVTQLSVNENDNFDFNAYQNSAAQNLKVEADSKINDAIAQQKKLKEIIAASKTEIQNAPQTTAATNIANLPQVTKEAEELQTKAFNMRTAANTKQGAEKEKLLNDAKEFEERSNEKYLEAATITKDDNTAVFNVNTGNLEALLKENKSPEPDLGNAKKLNDEAVLAFKQAESIRQESSTLTNIGAKIGSMSNAEEKEAEAILKQQQAVELLKKGNPAFVLKTPATPTASTTGNAETLNAQLEAVNKNLADLVDTKIESYQKLYDANAAELEQLSGSIKDKQTALDNTPSLKTDFIAGTNKTEAAKTLKAKADNAATKNDKLTNLVAAIKKQNEAVKQVSTLNASLDKIAVTPKTIEPVVTTTSNTNNTITPPVTTETTSTIETPVETEPVVTTANPNTAKEPVASSLDELAKKDTTAVQIVNYFNTNTPELKNQQAGNLVRNSLTQLTNSQAEETAIDEEIQAARQGNVAEAVDAAELKVKADNLLVEADQLSTKAQETRNQANAKTGNEKNNLLAQAKEQDNQSQSKSLEAATLNEKANAADYQMNSTAITELLEKLKTDNPTLHTELEQKSRDLVVLKSQAKELRQEANALDNTAARIGAISNVEEKETELLQKQNQLITDLKKTYPDYVVKKTASEVTTATGEVPATLVQRKKDVTEKQYTELTNLTNAFSLEYESSKNKVPKILSAAQLGSKQKAETLNAESKRLLIRSSQEKDAKEKMKLLTLAAKSGNAAVDELNKLLPQAVATTTVKTTADLDELNNIGNTISESNDNTNTTPPPIVNTPVVNTPEVRAPRNARNTTTVKVAGLEVIAGNAYNVNRPIPLNAKIEDGLVFRVQIGAFKVQLPNDAFKGLSPLNAETTANGYFRYTAGNFNKFENANAVKNDLRGLGYNDAFVVGYYNGKRISIAEAFALLEKEGKTINENAPQSAGITLNSNVPKVTPTPQATALNAQEAVTVAKELEQINGLMYTIQVGVYNKVSRQGLLNMRPIYTEKMAGGLYRYTAGIYNNIDKAITDKRKVVDLGIKDAFVSAYLNGKRISLNDAKSRQETDATIKMETENPVVFSEQAPVTNLPATTQPVTNLVTTTTVQPFTNGVNGYPAATADNGVKTTEEGISFKVQIGAYSKQVPEDVAAKFSAIKTWPVENKQINTLFIYNIGNFSEAKYAKLLKDEAVRVGLTDAFITVYKDGKKVYGPEATQYLNR